MENSRFQNFYLQTFKLFQVYLLTICLFSIARFIFLFRFGNLDILTKYTKDFFHALFNGFRFDGVVILYAFLPILLLNLILLIIKREGYYYFVNSFSKIYMIFIFSVLTIGLMADQQNYAFFQNHFDVVTLTLFEEIPTSIFLGIWTDNPVIRILLIFFVILFFIIKLLNRIYKQSTNVRIDKITIKISFVLLALSVYFIGLRASFGTFPLRMEDSTISDNVFINKLTPNGFFTLKDALKNKGRGFNKRKISDVLRDYNYDSVEQALTDYYNLPVEKFKGKDYRSFMFRTTSKSSILEDNPPNVIVIIVESLSNHFIDFHTEKNNLLGEFEKHLKSDYLFRNFMSDKNGTILSLEQMVLNTNYSYISETKYRFIKFNTSIAKPFKDAGYTTKFYTGLELGWHHLDQFIPNQYFDETHGKAAILKNYKEARANNTWGVYDNYLFDYIYKSLESADKPQFILSLTSTNHTPYELPEDYKALPIELAEDVKKQMVVNNEVATRVFTAYQYTCNSIGKFIDKIKNSKLAKNTIIVITGDHNVRNMFLYDSQYGQTLKFGVPLYLYIPPKYAENLHINTKRFGSSKDIMPSVYNLALSETNYFGLGNNLFSNSLPEREFIAINSKHNDSNNLGKEEMAKKANAYRALLDCYYNDLF